MTKETKIICDYTGEECKDGHVKLKWETTHTKYHKDITTRRGGIYHVAEEVIENIFEDTTQEIQFFTVNKEPVLYREIDMEKASIQSCDEDIKVFFGEVME